MSRSNCRRYKRYRQTHPAETKEIKLGQNRTAERQRYFGDMQSRREDGVIDLTPYNAATGQVLISTLQYDNGRSIVKRRGRPIMQGAL